MSAGLKLSGMRGRPDTWFDRSIRVIFRPSRSGSLTVAGRNLATGSSSLTSPRPTMSARMSEVKTLVIEPISKTVSASGATLPPGAVAPAARNRSPVASTRPTTIPTALWFSSVLLMSRDFSSPRSCAPNRTAAMNER